MSRPRKTPAERLAEAETAKMIAEFDILAERAAAAGMPAKQVRAIRSAFDLFVLAEEADEMGEWLERLSEVVERRAAAKEGASQ